MADGKAKVLLVEDDPFMTTLLTGELQRQGFEVVFAPSGEDALPKFQESKPDAIVLDILLPRKNGIETLREIRQMPGGDTVPVVVLSNLEDPTYMKDAEALGVKAYLIKANSELTEIVAKVKEAMKP